MASLRRPQFFSSFLSLFILLFHLIGCFIFSNSGHHHNRRRRAGDSSSSSSTFKKKFFNTSSPKLKSISSFLKSLFSNFSKKPTPPHPPPPPSMPSPSSSTRSLRSINNPYSQPIITPLDPTRLEENITNHPLLSRTDIFPCSVCGEIFRTQTLLEQHQSTKHAVSELINDGENIVRIIFKMGWPEKASKNPTIHRILKIHNSPKILTRFEEYRETVKSRAEAKARTLTTDERCIADGNELLRFCCTNFICDLDSSICSQQYCSACGIIRNGFSPKMDGISTLPTSWRAHVSIPEDLEEDFKFMHLKRALLLCRVIAGRIGCDPTLADKEDPGFDSLGGDEEDELLVFNPRAVLPCFLIVYTV